MGKRSTGVQAIQYIQLSTDHRHHNMGRDVCVKRNVTRRTCDRKSSFKCIESLFPCVKLISFSFFLTCFLFNDTVNLPLPPSGSRQPLRPRLSEDTHIYRLAYTVHLSAAANCGSGKNVNFQNVKRCTFTFFRSVFFPLDTSGAASHN